MKIVNDTLIFIRNDRNRRLAYLLVAIIAAILIFFPKPYVARTKIVPQDTSASAASTTALLGALGGGNAQSIGSLLTGGRPSNDLYLIIGRSDSVAEDVIRSLGLVGNGGRYSSDRDAKLDLDRHVDVHLLLGGVMEIETKHRDPEYAQRLTNAYAGAIGKLIA